MTSTPHPGRRLAAAGGPLVAPTRPRTDPRLHGSLLDTVVGVLRCAREVLGWACAPADTALADPRVARCALDEAWERAIAQLAVPEPDMSRRRRLVELVRCLKDAGDRVREAGALRQGRVADAVHAAMAMLGSPSSVSALLRRGPVAAASMGFDRILLSRIDDARWIPESSYFDRDAGWAQQLVEIGRRNPRTLDSSLLETEMVRRRVAVIVNDAQQRPTVHPELAAVTMSRSYAAAPIMASGRVVGFLHADCYFQQRHPDGTDREMLWLFSEGLSHALARASVLDRLEAMRAEAERLADHARTAMEVTGWPAARPRSRDGSAAPPAAAPTLPAPGADDGPLTRREAEVVRLLAAGDTNAQIATRLTISEGTVKTHVKHILRKLDAANRAEAVSRWLRSAAEGAPVGARAR